jgi:hypothetical protein
MICRNCLNAPSRTGFLVVLVACLAGLLPAFAQTIYEAENAALSGPVASTQYSGYSGTGYADYQNASGDYVEFSLVAGQTGSYPVAFRYANGSAGDRPLQLSVNGAVVVGSLGFPPTSGWANWTFTATNSVNLNAGPNTVRITSIGSNGANVDYMRVAANETSAPSPDAIGAPLRRPVSPSQPMLLVHIDTWNFPDPQKIIDLIPQDIRPYVAMNISLSISHDTNNVFNIAQYGYETAKSWVKTCAENGMWCMIQPASGGFTQFPDSDLAMFEEFYRDNPNFIGFNYAEQFWGFGNPPLAPTWTQRVAHWADLMKLNQKYGGYLVVSWCGNQYDPNINPIAMMKLNPAFAAICRASPQNFILEEKYTQQTYQSDMESVCLGTYLSGFCGQYGIRYDETGWTDANDIHTNFTMASAGVPLIEHGMLTGETVIDGPELIWAEDIQSLGNGAASNGYSTRRWGLFSQYLNVTLDIFRKVLDGTIRIPTRQEVIKRTKVIIVNDSTSGTADNMYSSPQSLFEGLYRMDGDGDYRANFNWMKKTGRFPTLPTCYQLADTNAQSFQLPVSNSVYSTRWPTVAAKTNELSAIFPLEYFGDIYAGRNENGWVIYNPYKTGATNGQMASGSIPFKYNTCDYMNLTLAQYTAGVIREYSNSLSIYLNNYDNFINLGMRTDTISIHGCSAQPVFTWADRAGHNASIVASNWSAGVFTLTATHNGPLDLTVNCAGIATNRLTQYTVGDIAPPAPPPACVGPHQYEAECFDYKSIAGYVANGYGSGVSNYTGQGYLKFGTSSAAAIRGNITVLKAGTYRLDTKYAVTGADVSSIDLYVNGAKITTPDFAQTPSLSSWALDRQYINLSAGSNTVEFRANGVGASSVYFDNLVVSPTVITGGIVIQENRAGFASVDGTIDHASPGYTGAGYANPSNSYGAGINWDLVFDSSAARSLTFRYAGTNEATANLLVNGTNVAADIHFPSTGALTNWQYVTIYPFIGAGNAAVRLESATNVGLPFIDYLEVTGGWGGTPPPTSLTAVAVATNQINLSWNASSNAISYSVKRSLATGGDYTVVASGVTATHFNDTGLVGGTTYYYVVSAVSSALGEGDDSVETDASTFSGLVTVLGMTNGLFAATANSGTTVGTFDLNDNANALVVGVYEDNNGETFPANLTTFGGIVPDGVIQASGVAGLNRMAAFYWLNPDTSAGQNLVIGSTVAGACGYFALQLSGVDTSAPVGQTGASTTDASSVNMTTTAANSFIVSFYSANDSGLTLTPSAPMSPVGSTLNTINGAGGGSLAAATNVLAAAGVENFTWSSSGTTAQQGVNGFAFAPIAGTLAIGPAGPETLTNNFNTGVLALSWPAGQGWRLQVQTNSLSNGLATNWVYVTDGTISATNIMVHPASGSVFYRLRYP